MPELPEARQSAVNNHVDGLTQRRMEELFGNLLAAKMINIVEPIKLEIENLAVNEGNRNLARTGKALKTFAKTLRY